MNLLDLLIAPAYAQAAARRRRWQHVSTLLFPIILIGVMYFLMIRPQMKRAKEHRAMLDKLGKGDEVHHQRRHRRHRRATSATASSPSRSPTTCSVRVQKGAIANVLPKGTLKSA